MSARLPAIDAKRGAKEGVVATAVLLALLLCKPVVKIVSGVSLGLFTVGELYFTLVAGFQIYVPLWLIQRRGELPEAYGIHAHGLLLGPIAALRKRVVTSLRRRRFRKRPGRVRGWLALYGRGAHLRPAPLFRDLGRALFLGLLTFPPFAIGHHFWQVHFNHAPAYAFTVPSDIAVTLLKNTFLIALPEEMFYRGFLEHRLDRLWPTKRMIWIVPLSRTVFLASFLFALGHFLGEYNLARFGPFFPAFVFSGLTRKGGSIAGAVLYHGMSNAFSALLFAGYV